MGIIYQRWSRPEAFVLLNHDAKDIIMSLTHAEAGVYFKLLTKLKFDETRLEVDSKKMTLKDMAAINKLERTTMHKYVSSLIKVGLIQKSGVERDAEYHINSEYAHRGNSVKGESYTRLYLQKAREALLPLSAGEVGAFGKLALFININTLTLCMDTEADTIEEACPLGSDDIVNIFDQDDRLVRRHLKTLKQKNLLYVRTLKTENKPKQITYLLHPDIVMRGGDDADIYDEVAYLFMSESERTAFVNSLYQVVEGERNHP